MAKVRANAREYMEISTDMIEFGGELERRAQALFDVSTLPAPQDPGHAKLTRATNDFHDAAWAWLKADADGTHNWWRRLGRRETGTTPAQTAPHETHIEGNGTDETGDAALFTQRLAEMAKALGVRFLFGTEVRGLRVDQGRVVSVSTSRGERTADVYVAAMGSYTPALLKPTRIGLPVYPVKGYSITVPIAREETAPVSTVMDETFKIAMTRLGSRIRVGGMAELSGFSHDLPPRRQATLKYSLNSLFPGAGALEEAKFWTGLRPMTPDGTPVLGATRVPNLYLNTGHGTLGWTMACGSARVVSDIITGREPEIEAADLSIARY